MLTPISVRFSSNKRTFKLDEYSVYTCTYAFETFETLVAFLFSKPVTTYILIPSWLCLTAFVRSFCTPRLIVRIYFYRIIFQQTTTYIFFISFFCSLLLLSTVRAVMLRGRCGVIESKWDRKREKVHVNSVLLGDPVLSSNTVLR